MQTVKIFWRLFGKYRSFILTLAVLGFLSAILEGIGINSIVPLMSFFNGQNGVPHDVISRAMAAVFFFFHIPFSFRYLLGFILLLFFIRAALMVFFGYIKGWITADFLSIESAAVLRGTLFASWPFLLRQRLGVIQNSAVRDVQQTSILLSTVTQLIHSGTGLLMYLLVAFNISPLVTVMNFLGSSSSCICQRMLFRQHMTKPLP